VKNYLFADAAIADFIIVVARNGVFVVDLQGSCLKYLQCPHGPYRKAIRRGIQQHSGGRNRCCHGSPTAFDIATAALAAELVGGMQRTLDITVEYAKLGTIRQTIGCSKRCQPQCADMSFGNREFPLRCH